MLKRSALLGLLIVFAVSQGFAGWVMLNQEQAVPEPEPVEGAFGTGVVELNAAGTELSYDITVTGLSGSINAAHFHGTAPEGESAGVVRTIEFEGNHASGVWTPSDDEPLTPELAQALRDGLIYVNVHTELNPPGEIRGQVHIGPSFNARLDQEQELPEPNPVEGAAGTGFALLNEDETEVQYQVTVTGLSSAPNAAHFHGPASSSETAGVVKGINMSGVFHVSGVWSVNDADQTLTPELIQSLKNGMLYFNVHTDLNPPGEIRGQIIPVAQSSSVKTWNALK